MENIGKKPDQKTDDHNGSKGNVVTRNLIGIITISICGAILILLIIFNWTIIRLPEEKLGHVKELFALLLPVIGTWVGTILAFYFTRENFEAANRSVSTLVKQVLSPAEKFKEMLVSEVMIKTEVFPMKKVENYDVFTKCHIKELIEKMRGDQSERLPILEEKSLKFIFLIYITTLERFLLGYIDGKFKLNDNSKPEVKALTIQNMFESDYQFGKEILELTEKQPLLPLNATLAEARQIMQNNTYCQDVFVTKSGSKDEKVEGWITNDLIVEKSELFKKSV